MNEINQQVNRARRRVATGKFFTMLTWAVFAGLLVAVIGMAIPKIWHLDFLQTQRNSDAWMYSWIVGGVVTGFLAAVFVTWKTLASRMDVAVEVDKRFDLRERLSSAMSLSDSEQESRVGQALVEDAVGRAETIDVRDEFKYQPTWRALLPLVPIALLVGLMFIPNAEKPVVALEPEAKPKPKKKVEVAVKKEFKKEMKEKLKKVTKGLKDADKFSKPLSEKLDRFLDEDKKDKKNSLIKLNDIKKEIEDRQSELGDSKEMRENLNKLKDLASGKAKKFSEALSKGDLESAKKAIKELADKLKEGKLNKVEMKKLAKDLKKMADELNKIAQKHEAEKKKLEDAIKKAVEKGDLDKAAKMQEKLNELKKKDAQKNEMKKMAQKLQKCANCMKPGGNGQKQQGKDGKKQPGQSSEQQAQAAKDAGESLEDLAEQIEGMAQQLKEMEALEDLQDMAEEIKGGMGQGMGNKPNWSDNAKGKGPGGGRRGEEAEDTGTFKSRQKGNLQKGETVVTGDADGENITGRSVSETRELVEAAMGSDSDPLQELKLPKSRREHGAEYFKKVRDN